MTEVQKQNRSPTPKTHRPISKKEWKPQNRNAEQGRKNRRSKEENTPKRPLPTRKDTNHYSMFESSTFYILDDLNSIAYLNDRIYNLLKVRPRNLWGRLVKCKCSRSKCEARYCECFSQGQVCGIECCCTNCNNTVQSRHEHAKTILNKQEMGCHCSKSQCLKNYCECFQRGLNCSENCRCSNCRNTA